MKRFVPLLLLVGCSSPSSGGDVAASSNGSSSSSGTSSEGGSCPYSAGGGGASSSAGGFGGATGCPSGFSATFTDLTDELPPPFEVPASEPGAQNPWILDTGGVFADVDGDGISEVILMHVTPPPGTLDGDTAPKIYSYEDSKLVQDGTFPPGMSTAFSFIPRAVVDIDGDGHLDIVTSSTISWGRSDGTFEPQVVLTSPNMNHGAVGALDIADLDSDGWLDVLIGGALCQPDALPLAPLLRTAVRTFEEDHDLIDQPIPGRSYAVMTTRVDGQMVVGTLYSSCFLPEGDPPPYYRWSGDKFTQFELLPVGYKLNSPMGAAIGDIDGDGDFDLTISEKHDYFAGGTIPLTDMTETTGFKDIPSGTLIPMIPWGVALLDLDRDGRPDVVTVHGNDFKAWFDPGWQVGEQWTTVHWNKGDFHFQEVDAGLGKKGQWKTLAVGDLEGDGDPDLIVGGGGEPPRVYRNDTKQGHALSIELRGTTSNPLGMGAVVDVWPTADGPKQHLLAGSVWSPDIVSQPLVFAGLGSATSAAKVQITWPSGTVQELHDLAGDKLHVIEEPPVLEVEPSTRHLVLGSATPAKIHVTPKNPDGSELSAVVTAETTGACSVSAVTAEGSGWRVEVTGPAAAGSCAVTVSIDGKPLDVRPRIWWK